MRARQFPRWSAAALLVTAVAAAGYSTALPAGQAGAKADAGEQLEEAVFTEDFLADPSQVEAGKGLWTKQCRHCHGKNAYPGKAPKLKPKRYTADYVYDRVTNGFRKMPAWKAVYTLEERMAIVAFIMSKEFSP